MGKDNFQIRPSFQDAAVDYRCNGQAGLGHHAQQIVQVVVLHSLLTRRDIGVDEYGRVQFGNRLEEWEIVRMIQIFSTYIGADLKAMQPEFIDRAFCFGNGRVNVLQRNGRQPQEAVGIFGHAFSDAFIQARCQFGSRAGLCPVRKRGGRGGDGRHRDLGAVHISQHLPGGVEVRRQRVIEVARANQMLAAISSPFDFGLEGVRTTGRVQKGFGKEVAMDIEGEHFIRSQQ